MLKHTADQPEAIPELLEPGTLQARGAALSCTSSMATRALCKPSAVLHWRTGFPGSVQLDVLEAEQDIFWQPAWNRQRGQCSCCFVLQA